MSEIRDRIARVLYESLSGKYGDFAWPGEAADALLAEFPILAGVTDEMVEAGARALADWDGADWDRPEQEFDAHEVITKRAYRVGATTVLTSALGSRDADAPGDGSAT